MVGIPLTKSAKASFQLVTSSSGCPQINEKLASLFLHSDISRALHVGWFKARTGQKSHHTKRLAQMVDNFKSRPEASSEAISHGTKKAKFITINHNSVMHMKMLISVMLTY